MLPGAPTLYQSLLTADDRSSYDLSSLRLAVTGAAVVPVVLIERMRAPQPEGLGIDQVVTAFGMTEAVVVDHVPRGRQRPRSSPPRADARSPAWRPGSESGTSCWCAGSS